jgi:hypothetical protein
MANSMNSNPARADRRRFLFTAGCVGTAVLAGVLPHVGSAQDLPHLTTADPTAQALGYTEDSTAVDESKYPTHKAGMACNNCNFFQGGAAAYGPCQLYAGKAVNAKGWCAGYAKKA